MFYSLVVTTLLYAESEQKADSADLKPRAYNNYPVP